MTIEAGTGDFFAAKFRTAVLYRIHERTGDRRALEEALRSYRAARAAWLQVADRAEGIYVRDLTVGELPWLRGNWADRLPAIDDDIADMQKGLEAAKLSGDPRVNQAILRALGSSNRPAVRVTHEPLTRFPAGKPLEVAFTTMTPLASARLYYRHVNQAERWQAGDTVGVGPRYSAFVPADYTDSQFPLQYYFELKTAPDQACLFPGFASNLANQPYFVARRA